ncbi:transmembrane protein 116 [Pocillopora verrucosa]|uniref:transmembrane protein 116 n=1 Tax=Pocillopora verrucosa TaxID=203993 RepID=UPI003340CAD5
MSNSMGSSIANNTSTKNAMVLICPIQSPKVKKEIAITYIVTSGLSILGASSVIIFSVWKRIVRSPEVHPLFHLALADLILASLWFAGACRWFHHETSACFLLDVIGEMAHLASFFLTVNYGLNAYIRLREKAKNITTFQLLSVSSTTSHLWPTRILYALCWLVPFAIMLPLLLAEDDKKRTPHDNCTHCLLLFDRPKAKSLPDDGKPRYWEAYGSIALVATLVFSIVALMVVYFLTVRTYRKAVLHSGVLTNLERVSIDAIRNKVFLYVLVFLVCWSPALVVAACDIAPGVTITNLQHWPLVFFFQGLTAPMQGFFNCIVYGWARKNFREASEQRRNILLESEDKFRFSGSRRTSYGSLRSMTSR